DALQYFDRLPRDRREAADLAGPYQMSRRVLAVDPFVSGLPAKAKAQRATDALTLAQTRLQDCARENGESLLETPPRTDLQILAAQLSRMQVDWGPRDLARFPERLDASMEFVFGVENATANACGEPQGDNRALWLLGRSTSVVNR
ncbi:MAG: hypothetical protein WB680_08520, partial [Candidatus Acidiferrales bacterium]